MNFKRGMYIDNLTVKFLDRRLAG